MKRNIEFNSEENIITSYTEIKPEQIKEILIYLNSLRFYWKKKYFKFIFRPHLHQKIVFDDLLGYIKPLDQKMQKDIRKIWRKRSKASK